MADSALGSSDASHVEDAAVTDQKFCNSTLHQDPQEPDSTHIVTNSFEEVVNIPTPDQQQAVANPVAVSAALDRIWLRDQQQQAMYNIQINNFGNNSSFGLPLDETHEWAVPYEQILTKLQRN